MTDIDDSLEELYATNKLAARLVAHGAASQTITDFTGMSRYRVANLRRRLAVPGHRGPPPHSLKGLIRARYLNCENPRDALLILQSDEFEFLIAALYRNQGYEVHVTKRSRDGGVDVQASRQEPGLRERVLIQCKRYARPVGVADIRELRGVVAHRQANKGVVITTGGFTKPARAFAAQDSMIELLDFGDLNILLNRVFGVKWRNSISYWIREEQVAAARKRSQAKAHDR